MIWLRESGIGGIADLRGKTIATAGIPYQDAYLKTILARADLTPDDVKTVNVGFGLLPAMLGGRADAMLGGFRNVEGVDLRLRGKDPVVTPVDQLGVPTYDELVLVANRERLEEDPEAIRLFLAALARGTAAAVEEPATRRPRCAARGQPGLDPTLTRPRWPRPCRCYADAVGYMDPAELGGVHRLDARQRLIGRCRDLRRCSPTTTCRARFPSSAKHALAQQARDLLRRQRAREEVALGVVAAEAAQLGELGLVLDPLGDRRRARARGPCR